jgi:deoxyribonuclease-4
MKIMILMETTAGQGETLGYRFEHFARIIEQVEEDGRVGVCLDTSHVFAAGYDIGTPEGCEATLEEFGQIIGLDRLKLIHLNDSQAALGSKVDRHEHIGLAILAWMPFDASCMTRVWVVSPSSWRPPKGRYQPARIGMS